MGLKSNAKGKAGERELAGLIADLTGWDVRRRVRQHDGDSDLCGVPGWSVECKRHATIGRADLRRWWAQAEHQAAQTHERPVLIYRRNRDDWRAVWALGPGGYEYTAEGSIEAWAMVAREGLS